MRKRGREGVKNRLSRVVQVGVSLPCVHMCTCEKDFMSTVYLVYLL